MGQAKGNRPVLVTGAAGFIGSAFVRMARPSNCPVVSVDAFTYSGLRENLSDLVDDPEHRLIEGDIRDEALMRPLLSQYRPDAIVNFAAESHVDRSIDDPRGFFSTNVDGTFTLLECARRHYRTLSAGEKARFRFLQVSTDEVFGSAAPGEQFTEDTPIRPTSPYAASKAAADLFVGSHYSTYGLPTLVTHCSNNYGPRQFPEKLIPHMIERALAEQTLPVYGDGRHARDWLHVDDHCNAILTVVAKGTPGQSYGIGSGRAIANLDLVRQLCSILDEARPRANGRSHQDLIRFVADRPGHDRRYEMNCTKIAESLDWRPTIPFLEGLRDTVQWYLEHDAWRQVVKERGYRASRLGLGAFGSERISA